MAFCLVILHTQLYDEEGQTLWHSVVKCQQCNGDNAKFYTTYITSNAAISRDHSLNAIEETWYKINGNWLRKSKIFISGVFYRSKLECTFKSMHILRCIALYWRAWEVPFDIFNRLITDFESFERETLIWAESNNIGFQRTVNEAWFCSQLVSTQMYWFLLSFWNSYALARNSVSTDDRGAKTGIDIDCQWLIDCITIDWSHQ